MKTSLFTFFLVNIFLLFLLNICRGQEQLQGFALAGPEKTIVLGAPAFYEKKGDFLLPTTEKIVIERSDNDAKRFKKVAEIQFPATANEMSERLGPYAQDVINQLNVANMQQAREYLLKRGLDSLGLMLISPDIQEALGLIYIDRERDPQKASVYRLSLASNQDHAIQIAVAAGLPTYLDKYRIQDLVNSDSTVIIQWGSIIKSYDQSFPLFAKVYKQKGAHQKFIEHNKSLVFMQSTDTALVKFSDEVSPGQNLAYYIQIEDIAGNQGIPSDTVFTLSQSRSTVKPILNLFVKDTLNGMLLSWDSIPDLAIYGGIQILKSRQVNTDYVVLDTVPINEISYLDTRVIKGSSYYYRIRPLLLQFNHSDPLPFAEVGGNYGAVDSIPPQKPEGLSIIAEEKGIRLHWQQGPELNLFGYYVLRGTSANDMSVIASSVTDYTYLDTAMLPGYAGQLHYALQAISLNQLVSDTSDIASIAIRQPVVLNPPAGLRSRWSDVGVALEWDDVSLRDERIAGFMLFRKDPDQKEFKPILNSLLEIPYYTDTTALSGQKYTYAVASVDAIGNHSILSNLSELMSEKSSSVLLPQELYIRNLNAGIEIFWPETTFQKGDQYVIYRKADHQKQYEKIGTTNPDQPFMDKQVKANVLYDYQVKVLSNQAEGKLGVEKSIRRVQY